MFLIDTSVWIAFLRGDAGERVRLLESLLEEGDAHLCEVTFAEILFGAKDKRQYERYVERFSEMPFFGLPSGWHGRVARMGFELRKAGHRPFFADLAIGLTAIAHGAVLLTEDRDFLPYADLFGLRLQ